MSVGPVGAGNVPDGSNIHTCLDLDVQTERRAACNNTHVYTVTPEIVTGHPVLSVLCGRCDQYSKAIDTDGKVDVS